MVEIMSEREPIDICPYCESEDVDIGYEESCSGVRLFVFCRNCEMNGPYEELEISAILDWNHLSRGMQHWNKVKDGGCCLD